MTSLSAIEYDPIVEFRQLIHSGFKLLVNENTPVLKPIVAEVCIFLVTISTSFVASCEKIKLILIVTY